VDQIPGPLSLSSTNVPQPRTSIFIRTAPLGWSLPSLIPTKRRSPNILSGIPQTFRQMTHPRPRTEQQSKTASLLRGRTDVFEFFIRAQVRRNPASGKSAYLLSRSGRRPGITLTKRWEIFESTNSTARVLPSPRFSCLKTGLTCSARGHGTRWINFRKPGGEGNDQGQLQDIFRCIKELLDYLLRLPSSAVTMLMPSLLGSPIALISCRLHFRTQNTSGGRRRTWLFFLPASPSSRGFQRDSGSTY